jgi:hypothetical protein
MWVVKVKVRAKVKVLGYLSVSEREPWLCMAMLFYGTVPVCWWQW